MDPTKQLLRLRLRLYDCVTDITDVTAITTLFFETIKDEFQWHWPDTKSHLCNRAPSQDLEAYRQRDPKEHNDAYHERLQLIDTSPQRNAKEQADWIRHATIVTNTLRFLSDKFSLGEIMKGDHEGRRYAFNPRRLYEYTWMCLHQGLGPRAWMIQPDEPPEDIKGSELTLWYTETAENTLERVRTKWEQGEDLDAQFASPTIKEISLMYQHLRD